MTHYAADAVRACLFRESYKTQVCAAVGHSLIELGVIVVMVYVIAELGDWNQIEDHDYVSNMRMLPKQSLKFTDKVADLHKSLE